ncbi:RHS repeat-associated core domain-containing protein [Flavobacterium restrictum]|uniref:RHS repeat-associated core domain-containing protein n=1 Tax=Flavobacterium restrictum TaxID=2594428 RepID=A0A553DW57_9FLAO|nr:RHS repeat-associated core domain-containing protein [Flavobacterium restrictum]TRX37024.1 hypothetical protein FNW21_12575 [Flavobacterium restrictum]
MKHYYILLCFFISQLFFGQNFQDTKGELQISNSGSAVYNLPIAMPPSIKNVAPIINLTYSSGVRGGIAGQGWNINSISTISRMATRRDIDGFVDGVDFDADDKLALDGQRLLLKTGTYWTTGSTYETEYKSNTKIELKIENGGAATFFIVTTPDGSRTWYGSTGGGTYQNAVSTNAWYIVRFEDTYGNTINYNYTTVTFNSTNQLYVDNITFSGNATAGIIAQDKIQFNYRDAKRIERDYTKGVPVYATKILDNIQVVANTVLFRKYQLTQVADTSLGYERVTSIVESNTIGEVSNPVIFEYNTTPTTTTRTEKTYTNTLNFNETDLAGDFDGDGRLDFVANNQVYVNLFNGTTGNEPVNLPFTASKWQVFTATTLTSSKLNQFQSIIFEDNISNSKAFKVYNLTNNTIQLSYTKSLSTDTVPLIAEAETRKYVNVTQYMGANNAFVAPTVGVSSQYLEGDFNGDGISEVLIINPKTKYHKETTFYVNASGGNTDGGYLTQAIIESNGEDLYVADLNVNASVTMGDKGFVKLPYTTLKLSSNSGGSNYIMDFNGDGKSDIFQIKPDYTYVVYSFKQLSASPWMELEIIGEGTTPDNNLSKFKLFGDYNGDGKTDIMIPDGDGKSPNQTLWNIYYANPKPTAGEFFVKESHNIVEYWPNTGTYYNTQTHLSSYYAIDINGDGKSDLVRVWRKYYKPAWTINDHNTQWNVTAFSNNIGNTTSTTTFPLTYDSGIFDSPSPDIPIPITSNYKYQGGNTDLVIVRGHYNKIEYYQFNKNLDTDNRLKSVTESNGNIKQTIDYKTMEATDSGLGNYATDFYSSSNTSVYPNLEVIRNTSSFLVSKVTATINGVSKYQDFKYSGYISNFNYGTVGFKRTSRSSWYVDSATDPKIWSTYNNDENLRGANTITWSSTNAATVFAPVPDNLLSTKTNVFATYVNPTSKVYNVLLSSQTALDALTTVKSESIFTYDGTVTSPSYYGLQTSTVSKQYIGSTLQGTTTSTTTYDNNPTGVGSAYYIGRPKSTNTSTTSYTPDTRVSGEAYTYTGNNLTKTEKTGNNTYAIVEDMTYDAIGNLLTKTVSAPAAPTPIAARTIIDEYDPTKRFVTKKTDHQGFVTNFVYNTLGQVTQSTNYLGVVSDYTFDNWGKLTKSKTTGVSLTPLETTISYVKLSDGGYTTTSENTVGDQAKSITQYDVLGRAIVTTTKGFAINSTISKQVVYDALGRKLKESEPYYTAPTKWTAYEYDYLQRPTKVTTPAGRVQTLAYAGLTTTSTDDGKITTATADALGNKIQTTDPGGTINFTFYANGQLKESNYDGHKVSISIDGWGNKTAMNDPNAGTYSYTYDAFGQPLTETTPKGTTTNTYDTYGKLLKKKTGGDGADFETDYVYNSFAQLTSESSKKAIGTPIDTFTYGFDSLHRLTTTTESNTSFTQTKTITYDSYGRPITAVNATQELTTGLSTSIMTKNTYNTYNGIMDKMTDATDAVLWQLNTANEKMQSLTETLGNGVNITNQYSADGYFTSQNHLKGTTTILDNRYNFNAVKGTLQNRQNMLHGYYSEEFGYDTLDRLTTITTNEKFINNTFSTTDTEGFQAEAGATTSSSAGQLTTQAAIAGATVKKTIQVGAKLGDSVLLNFDLNRVMGTDELKVYIEEKDPTTGNSTKYFYQTVTVGRNVYINHTVTQYTTLVLRIEKTTTTALNVFLIDNVIGGKVYRREQLYDTKGRITKNGIGDYNYNTTLATGIYRKKSITLAPEAKDYYTNLPKQVVTYTMFKSPISINESDKGSTQFVYNSHLSRQMMTYGYTIPTPGATGVYTKTKNYTDDGTVEILKTPTTITIRTFIGGDAYSAPLYIDKIKTIATGAIVDKKYYLHRDYLGSIIAITDAAGIAVERRHFDAWGNLAKLEQNGVAVTLPTNGTSGGLMMLDRGYTGHEHLAEVGLIQMNGRLYDPVLRTFLMPDNFIQQPENTQNYNRYAYVLNNPLKYTDPSGELFGLDDLAAAIIIGAVIAATTYTMTALLADVPFTVGGLAKATFVGAASAAVTFGIGTAAGNLFTNFFSRAAFQALAHGMFQGTMSGIQGGKFFSSFVAGALSSIAASAFAGGSSNNSQGQEIYNTGMKGLGAGMGNAGMIAFGSISGGAGAALTGGNFWQGAVTGLVVSGLNHAMHKMQERQSFKEQLKAKGINPNGKFGFTEEAIGKNINAIKELRMLASKADSKISAYEFREALVTENGMEAYGESEMMPDNSWKVSLSMSKIVTNLDFVYTIGHEFTHILNMSNMNYAGFHSMTNPQKYQEELNVWTNFNQVYGDPNAQAGINYYQNLLKK